MNNARIEELERKAAELTAEIAKLREQETVGEYIPRPGEIAEFRDHDAGVWRVDVFRGLNEDTSYVYGCERTEWVLCRPLSNPLVLQFRPHVPGDPMPCDGSTDVRMLRRDGLIFTGDAAGFLWKNLIDFPDQEIIGWLPVGQRA